MKEMTAKENSYLNYENQLTGEYYEVYDKIRTYAMTQGGTIDDARFNELMLELIDLFTEAQHRGEPVEKIVGKDMKVFCKNYFSEDKSIMNIMKGLTKYFYLVSMIWFVVSIIDLAVELGNAKNILKIKSDFNIFSFTTIAAILVYSLVMLISQQFVFRWKKFTSKVYVGIVTAVTILLIVAVVIFTSNVNIKIPTVWVILAAFIYAVCYKVIVFYERYKKYGSIKKPEEERALSIKNAWNIGVEQGVQEIIFDYEKDFVRQNKRRKKKHKDMITEEQFTEKVRKDVQYDKSTWIYYVIFGAGVVIPVVREILVENTGIFDILTYAAILIVVEGFLLKMFLGMAKLNYKERKSLIDECDREGITIVELARRRRGSIYGVRPRR